MPDPKKTSAADTSQMAPLIQMVRDQSATLATIAEKQKRVEELETSVRRLEEQVRRQSISMPGAEDLVKSGEWSWSRAMGAIAYGKPELAPAEFALSRECYKRLSGDIEKRIMTTLTDSAGGFLVPEEISGTLVPKLDAMSVMISQMGVTVVTPKGYPFRVNKITGGTTASMVGEGSAATASDLTIGQVNLMPKKCQARTIITNEQVMWGDPKTDAAVMDDLALRIALKEDQQIIAGTGDQNEVTGIAPSGATAAGSTYSTVAGADTSLVLFGDFNKAMAALAEADALNDDVRAVMHPRTWFSLQRQLNAGAATTQTEALGAGFVAGFPFFSRARFKEITGITVAVTSQMPTTYNTNDTWIFVGGWNGFSEYWFARFGGLVLAKSDVASDGTHHAFTDDKVHVKAVTWFDGAAIRPKTICIVTGYDYASIND